MVKLNNENCLNCHEMFVSLIPNVKKIIYPHHFKKDSSDLDINEIIDAKHEYSTRLHKFEKTIEGNHIFRAIIKRKHIVYTIDKDNRLIFLKVFKNFDMYMKFLEDEHQIINTIENI